MKKKIVVAVLVIIGIFTALFIYSIAIKLKFRSKIESKQASIPSFKFRTLTDTTKYFETKDLSKDQPVVVIYFSTLCGSCQYEATMLPQNENSFKNAAIIMVSDQPFSMIEDFYKNYKLDKMKNLVVLKSDDDGFYKAFGTRSTPGIYIYNKNGKTLKSYLGETRISAITQWL